MVSKSGVIHFRTICSILLLILLITSCAQISTHIHKEQPALAPSPSVPTLRSLAQSHGIYIGTAVSTGALQKEDQYETILASEFNMVTPEVSMKFDATEPEHGHYAFHEGDILVAFAKAHTMQVRGHNLVWYIALPAWLTAGHFSRNELMTILHEHILNLVSHYRGQVNIWDVVNEAVNDDGTLRDTLIWLFVGRTKPIQRLGYSIMTMVVKD